MVKPGLILPSERMNSICSLTNDGFGSYDDDGNLVLGDNDGKGKGSNVFLLKSRNHRLKYP